MNQPLSFKMFLLEIVTIVWRKEGFKLMDLIDILFIGYGFIG